MPKYLVKKDVDACSASKPWAVVTQGGPGDGNVHGCFASKAAARQQQKAIYASTSEANSAEAAMNGQENRAKYTAAQVEELGKAGKAFRNDDGSYSYPIDDVADLKKAVRAVGRGSADHDAIRKFIIKRAKALGQGDLIPDSWNADGSISEANGGYWSTEQRDTANDVWSGLSAVLSDALGNQYEEWNSWVMDWYGADNDSYLVVYYYSGDIYQASFSYDDNNVMTIDVENAEKVRQVTTYIPRSQRAADDTCTTCDGTGKIMSGNRKCPDCGGSGERGGTEAPEQRATTKPVMKQTMAFRKAKMPKKGEREVRTLPIEELSIEEMEVRSEDGDEQRLLEFNGHASVFNRSYSVGPYEEEISPGAFTRSLGNPQLDTVLRIEHKDLPLARTTGTVTLPDGTVQPTLSLSEDSHGLHVRAYLDPSDPDVQRIVPKMRRGDLKEMSFAFRSTDDLWSDDYSHRTIRGAEIHRGDVAIVTYGASPTTTSTLRSEEAVTAIHAFGLARFFEAFVEWRDFTLLSEEARQGKSLSSESMEFLQRLFQLAANADDADDAQPLLADFMAVSAPDSEEGDVIDPERSENEPVTPEAGEPTSEPTEPAEPAERAANDDHEVRRARQRADDAMMEAELALLKRGGSR